MGNVAAHDLAPVTRNERKILDLSHKVTAKQYVKHLNGEVQEAYLTELPWPIRDSVLLYETMTVAFNAITEIPVELPLRLPHLSNLNLSHNHLHSLPESFGLFFHLKEIQLQHNQLSSLPESFIHLVKLEKLDLSYNELRQLPEDLGTMESLKLLNVTHNKLKELPLSLGSPSCHLHLILAQQNRLESPPQAVCEEGSTSTLNYIRKQYLNNCAVYPIRPVVTLNRFPRCCGNKLESLVSNPHSAQVQYIQEQTNTTHTTNRIKAPLLPPINATTLTPFQLRDRIIGLIYGAAIGDAIGVACQWMSDDECAFYYPSDDDLVYNKIVQDEHRVLWRHGDWTSNFDQFMLVLESLVSWAGVVDELEFARRLQAWAKCGFPELGDSVGILTSETVRKVVSHSDFCIDPHAVSKAVLRNSRGVENGTLTSVAEEKGFSAVTSHTATIAFSSHAQLKKLSSSSPSLSSLSLCSHVEVAQNLVYTVPSDLFGVDNGAVIRAAVLGVPNFHELQEVEGNAVRICKTTHADNKCVASCVLVSLLVALLMQGKLIDMEQEVQTVADDQLEVAFNRAAEYLTDEGEKKEFLAIKRLQTFTNFNAKEPSHMGHTYTPVKAALLALHWKDDYRSFISALTRLAGDSSSNACVAGAVLGCSWGYSRLPQVWVEGLRKRQVQWLNSKINHLLDVMGSP